MDMDTEIKLAKFEHEHAVLTARKMEIKKQILESKKTLVTLESEQAKVLERLSATQSTIDSILEGE
jgi:hypothetical protein